MSILHIAACGRTKASYCTHDVVNNRTLILFSNNSNKSISSFGI